jgi:hypothetical protein
MSKIGHNFAAAPELEIPKDVKPGAGWTPRMLEMAAHIGPYLTLVLIDRFGGQRVYFPADPARGKFYPDIGTIQDVVGAQAAAILSYVYQREYVPIATARLALRRARRQALIASARAGDITVSEAARKIGTSRPYMSYLVNQTDEGAEGGEILPLQRKRSPGQMDMFGDEGDA